MTKEEWALAEKQISRMFGGCELLVDGYRVGLRMEPISTYKNVIMIYINRKWQWAWCLDDCEERRRFCRPETHSLIRTQEQRESLKKCTKKFQKEVRERSKFVTYIPYWNSFASLKRHFIKNNTSIELVKGDDT